ncbi:hypothetical protein MBLNU459_g7398t1 [Dothideomycetes sp. NU459]
MHDLRRQALESGKTVSRKAKSKAASTASSKNNSPATSRAASRVGSRNVSDEEGDLSDSTTQWSVNSLDELRPEDVDVPTETWVADLTERINQITDRKRSSVQGREESLHEFTRLLIIHFAQREIQSRVEELVPAILKSVKGGQSEKETTVALKALALLLVTEPSDHIYDAIVGPIKLVISDSQYAHAKLAAIHTLGVATYYGGAGTTEIQDVMDYLVEIVESDGHSIEAGDNGQIVTAALEEWGFLATLVEDMEDTSEEPMEAFVEQLESTDVNVQVAAGENIALLYEKSYTEREEDEEPETRDVDSDDEDAPTADMVKRYTVYRRQDQLIHTLEALATASSKRMSKKDRKSLHTNFADISNSINRPWVGPRYSNAIDQATGKAYGSRMTISVGGKSSMTISKWWQLIRLKSLRRVLQGGFLIHYEDNEVIFDTLPLMVE